MIYDLTNYGIISDIVLKYANTFEPGKQQAVLDVLDVVAV